MLLNTFPRGYRVAAGHGRLPRDTARYPHTSRLPGRASVGMGRGGGPNDVQMQGGRGMPWYAGVGRPAPKARDRWTPIFQWGTNLPVVGVVGDGGDPRCWDLLAAAPKPDLLRTAMFLSGIGSILWKPAVHQQRHLSGKVKAQRIPE